MHLVQNTLDSEYFRQIEREVEGAREADILKKLVPTRRCVNYLIAPTTEEDLRLNFKL
jgi:hypothetical protein